MNDPRDLALEQLAADEADAREAVRQLVDLVADLAFENATLRTLYERELVSRIHADGTIRRLQRLVYRQRTAA